MDDLIAFYEAQLNEDEWWAREASRKGKHPVPDAGHHWRWEDTDTDEVITPDPSAQEYLGHSGKARRLSLRSIEDYPSGLINDKLPQFAITFAEEIPTAVGGHITRHDPARVLAEIRAKRLRLEHYLKVCDLADPTKHPAQEYVLAKGAVERSLMLDALPYAGRPGYKETWRP